MFHMLQLSFSLWAHKTEWKQAASTRIFSFACVSYAATKTNVRALILELIIITFYSWPNPTSVTYFIKTSFSWKISDIFSQIFTYVFQLLKTTNTDFNFFPFYLQYLALNLLLGKKKKTNTKNNPPKNPQNEKRDCKRKGISLGDTWYYTCPCEIQKKNKNCIFYINYGQLISSQVNRYLQLSLKKLTQYLSNEF